MTYTQTLTNTIVALAVVGLTLGAGASLAFAEEDDNKPFADLRAKHKSAVSAWKTEREDARSKRDAFKASTVDFSKDIHERLKNATTDEERDVIKAEAKVRRVEIRDTARDYANDHKGRIMKRLTNAITYLESLTERIQNFLNEKAAQGIDTSVAQIQLDEAKEAVRGATVDVQTAKEVIERVLGTDNPRDYKDEVRAAVKKAVQSIKDAHKQIKEAVRAAKALNN